MEVRGDSAAMNCVATQIDGEGAVATQCGATQETEGESK